MAPDERQDVDVVSTWRTTRVMLTRTAGGRGRAGLGAGWRVRAVVLLELAGLIACSDDGGPRLDVVLPRAASRNATVTLTGRRLCGASGDCTTAAGEIQIGLASPTVRAVVVSYSDTEARLVIPLAAALGDTVLIATVNERASNALDFEVLP